MAILRVNEKYDDSALCVTDTLLPLDNRTHEAVSLLENEAVAKYPTIEIGLEHLFSNGLYLRSVFIPKGTFLTGKIHKEQHLVTIAQGAMTVWTEGKGCEFVAFGDHFVSQPGTRRIGYAWEDTTWITVHPNPENETDTGVLNDRLFWVRDQFGWTGREIGAGDDGDLVKLLPPGFLDGLERGAA